MTIIIFSFIKIKESGKILINVM